MGLLSRLAAASYYHPWLTTTVIGVIITVIYVIVGRRRKIANSPSPECQRGFGEAGRIPHER